MDKRQVYDTNTRIHLLATGPGIAAKSIFDLPATQVDMAPTFLSLAGLQKPPEMDGKSFLPLLVDESNLAALPASTAQYMASAKSASSLRQSWRDSVLIEYYFVQENDKVSHF